MTPSPSDGSARIPSVEKTPTALLCSALLGCTSAPPDPPSRTDRARSSGEGAGVEDTVSLRPADHHADIDSLPRGLETAPGVSPVSRPEERPAPVTPGRWYWVYVANRESDVVSRVRFGPEGGGYEKSVRVGVMPRETDGPVGVHIAPDGEHWYLTTSAPSPVTSLFKYETGTDRLVDSCELGAFASSLDLTADVAEAWLTSAEADGGRGGGSSLSGAWTDGLWEVGRLRACSRSGWGHMARSGDRLWLARAGNDGVMEVDAGNLEIRRVLPTGSGPAALAVTPDERFLLATNRDGQSVSVISLEEGSEVARLSASRPSPGGVAVSDDGRYAFVTNTSSGGERSTVDVFDLRAMARVAEVEVEHGAAGIAFWRSLAVKR